MLGWTTIRDPTGGTTHEMDALCSRTRSTLRDVDSFSGCRDAEVRRRLGEGRQRLHRQVRGERLAGRALEHGAREPRAEGEGDARGPDGRRRDAVEPIPVMHTRLSGEL